MPEYLDLAGRLVEEYSPDGVSKVSIVDLGFEYAYCLEPVKLSEEEQARLDEVMERLAYRIKPKDLLNPHELEETLKSWGLSDKVVYVVKAEVVGYSWLEPLMHDEGLEDIQCFKANTPIKVTHRDYGLMRTNIVPNEDEVDISIVSPEALPRVKDWIYASMSVNSLILALVTGKTLDWRLGGSFRDLMIISLMILASLSLGLTLGLL